MIMRNNFDKFLNILIKVQLDSFVNLREGISLFHQIDDEELNIFLSYLIQWVICWNNVMELVLLKGVLFSLVVLLK